MLLDVVYAGYLFHCFECKFDLESLAGIMGMNLQYENAGHFQVQKNFRVFLLLILSFHAKTPFRTAFLQHLTSIAGGSKEKTLNANRIPGTAGSARISVTI